jgi:hypothetical protein
MRHQQWLQHGQVSSRAAHETLRTIKLGPPFRRAWATVGSTGGGCCGAIEFRFAAVELNGGDRRADR